MTCDFIPHLHVWLSYWYDLEFSYRYEYFATILDWLMKTTHALPVPVYQETVSYRNEWPFHVFMILVQVFILEQKSRPGTATGMNSFRYESYRYEILDRYHVNEYRATRGNRDELIPVWKSYQYHVNTPLQWKHDTVPPKCKLKLDSRFSRESRIEDRVSILNSILNTRFSQKLSTRNFPDYADLMQVARKRFISCEERTITTMLDCRSTHNPSKANVFTTARTWRKSLHWKLRFEK